MTRAAVTTFNTYHAVVQLKPIKKPIIARLISTQLPMPSYRRIAFRIVTSRRIKYFQFIKTTFQQLLQEWRIKWARFRFTADHDNVTPVTDYVKVSDKLATGMKGDSLQ